MESSFFEYRDKTEAGSDSDTEIINDSEGEESFILSIKTPLKKNHTIIPDSGESVDDDESEEEEAKPKFLKPVARQSIAETVICSSDDGASEQGSRAQSQNMSYTNGDASSSDEDEVSPELVPKRRPPLRPKSLNSTTESPIVRRVKKRMILLDSDTDNSIIIEKEKNRKMKCLKDTPLKIDVCKENNENNVNDSEESGSDATDDEDDDNTKASKNAKSNGGEDSKINASEESGSDASDYDDDNTKASKIAKNNGGKKNKIIDSEENGCDSTDYDDDNIKASKNATNKGGKKNKIIDSDESGSNATDDDAEASDNAKAKDSDASDNIKINVGKEIKVSNSKESGSEVYTTDDDNDATADKAASDDDGGSDEDQMVMSRATRMSIMGIIPKQNESDDSDFIESDDSVKRSVDGSTDSLTDLPEVDLTRRLSLKPNTPEKPKTPAPKTSERSQSANDSRLSCSPIASPVHETKEFNNSKSDSPVLSKKLTPKSIQRDALKNKVMNKLMADDASKKNTKAEDDDVTVIDWTPEVITLSSDDEEEIQPAKKPPNSRKSSSVKKSPTPQADTSTARRSRDNTIRQYLPPPSYPNQVQYVQKHVLDNELNKLNKLQAELHNTKNVLENMDVTTLPDGGTKLIMRLTALEHQVRQQGDYVGNMVVEPSQPTPADIARDGFDQGLSWDDIKQASNAVQPRMFGKQAMATHLAERNLILDRLRDLHESLDSRPPEDQLAAAPAALKTELMPHQLHALAWLRWRETQSPAGGILADDMGLGKTITMISLVASDKELRDDDDDDDDDERPRGKLVKGGTLVVCPASLMSQWEGEVGKHCVPHRVTTCLHHGAARATQPQRLAHADMVLTTYNILLRDSEKSGVLTRVRWRRVILDEGHIVRNHKSATSGAVCGLRARRRWALTGTPVHNKDLDLFALLKFLRCTPFDDLTMWKKWIDNKSSGGQERLSTIMRCILLRRTKAQLQARGLLPSLPPRTHRDTPVTLTKEEMNVYQKVLVFSKTLFAQFLHQRAEKQADGAGFLPPGKETAYDNMHKRMIALQGAKPVKSHEILVLLLRLRQVCCHCGLIAAMLDPEDAGAARDDAGQDLLAELNKLSLEDQRAKRRGQTTEEAPEPPEQEEGTTAAEAIRSVLSLNNPVFELTQRSSKIQAVMDCLNHNVLNKKGEKAVVVSQWTSVLRLVEQELKKEKVRAVTLSGNVPVPARAALVDALNNPKSDVRVMLLSLCAGGVGLNLCGANHLLLLDPHWNPQLEQQAQDRVYRVGQARHVHVYRFMCVDTVEQSIRKLQEAKLELAENVLTGARHTNASKLSIEDLKLLFNMGPPVVG